MASTSYHDLVKLVEDGLPDYAQHSFDPKSQVFLNGKEILKHFQDLWSTPLGQLKLANRTPLQLERDRILYSSALRKQTEKYHVLFSGFRRVIRNYTTHTMRVAHVTRAICKALRLNADFAEAIALGSKVGAAPFIHVTKNVAGDWLLRRLRESEAQELAKNPPQSKATNDIQLWFPSFDKASPPTWFASIKARCVAEQVAQYVPLALGDNVEAVYSSGATSYWLLCTDPFLRESARGNYHPETMYGIWRHSRLMRPKAKAFFHTWSAGANCNHHITWEHSTYEGMVVQFADDMTWIIENLNDANDAALLGGARTNLFLQLMHSLSDVPQELKQALAEMDAGALYTYFISDFVQSSSRILTEGTGVREGLRRGDSAASIGPSVEAEECLNTMEKFLFTNVFEQTRIRSRNRMLQSVSDTALDILYDKKEPALLHIVEDRANLENWPSEKRERAIKMLANDVHRAQLSVDLFASMGDQDLFEFVSCQAF